MTEVSKVGKRGTVVIPARLDIETHRRVGSIPQQPNVRGTQTLELQAKQRVQIGQPSRAVIASVADLDTSWPP